MFAGRRGRLLAGLLGAEFAGALTSIAYATVLPVAAADIGGRSLYGATLAAGTLTTILVLAAGPGALTRLAPRHLLAAATALYVAGVACRAAAPAMAVVLAGSVLTGISGGLLASFGLTAIGALYEDEIRSRVLGLFAVVWLLPSLAGPLLNAAVTSTLGWRWAMAWPAGLVLLARALVGRDADLIPWRREPRRLDLRTGLAVVAGLAVAAAAGVVPLGAGVALLVAGLATAVVGSAIAIRRMLGDGRRTGPALSLLALSLAYFGGSGIVSLAVISGLGYGVVAGSVAYGAGLVMWSLTGLRPPRPRRWDRVVAGLGAVAVALAGEALAQLPGLPAAAALGIAVVGWALAGLGMGVAYPLLSAEPFDGLPATAAPPTAAAVALAEAAGTTAGSLLGGGVYAVGTSAHASPGTALGAGFAALAVVALAAAVTRRHAPPAPLG